MSDDMRDRFKSQKKGSSHQKSEGIFGIWQDQKRIQAEEQKVARELAEAKKKARELKKQQIKNKSKNVKLAARTKLKSSLSKSTSKLKNTKSWFSAQNNYARGLSVFVLVGVIGVISYSLLKPSSPATLGESTSVLQSENDLRREKPAFSLLFPNGASEEDYEVVRISPGQADASYTFLDRFTEDGPIFRVTQQEIPVNFELTKTATDFQATNVIQIDEDRVYHGYSERGGVQSLIFTRKDKLIFIRSPQRFPDDTWASYIISLQ